MYSQNNYLYKHWPPHIILWRLISNENICGVNDGKNWIEFNFKCIRFFFSKNNNYYSRSIYLFTRDVPRECIVCYVVWSDDVGVAFIVIIHQSPLFKKKTKQYEKSPRDTTVSLYYYNNKREKNVYYKMFLYDELENKLERKKRKNKT